MNLMKCTALFVSLLAGFAPVLLAQDGGMRAPVLAAGMPAKDEIVTYEAFGAVGDGVADDLPAIVKAHEHANTRGLKVRTKPDATYHLGRKALTVMIATDKIGRAHV